jgi:hypothetical protein
MNTYDPDDTNFITLRNTLKSTTPSSKEVADDLVRVRNELDGRHATYASARLTSINKQIGALRYDVIHAIVAPEQAFEELDHTGGTWSRRIGAFRNVLALAPLVLTWIALKVASEAYHAQLAKNSSLLGTPFLDLWQGGFGGRLGLTFSTTATWDFVLLFLLLLLTIALHIGEGIEERRANTIIGDLNRGLTKLAIAVQQHETFTHTTDPVEAARAMAQAIENARVSMQSISATNEKIAKQAESSMKALEASMISGVTEVKREYESFIQGRADEVGRLLREVAKQTDDVFNVKLGPSITKFVSAAQQYEESSSQLAGAATKLSTSSDELAHTTSGMDIHIASLDTNIGKVGSGVDRMTKAADGVIENNEHMDEVNTRLGEVSDRLKHVVAQLGTVSKQLNDASWNLADAAGKVPKGPPPPRKRWWQI